MFNVPLNAAPTGIKCCKPTLTHTAVNPRMTPFFVHRNILKNPKAIDTCTAGANHRERLEFRRNRNHKHRSRTRRRMM